MRSFRSCWTRIKRTSRLKNALARFEYMLDHDPHPIGGQYSNNAGFIKSNLGGLQLLIAAAQPWAQLMHLAILDLSWADVRLAS